MSKKEITVETVSGCYGELISFSLAKGQLGLSDLNHLRSDPFILAPSSSELYYLSEGLRQLQQCVVNQLSTDEQAQLQGALEKTLEDLEYKNKRARLASEEAQVEHNCLPRLLIRQEFLDQLPSIHRAEMERFLRAIESTYMFHEQKDVRVYVFGSMARGKYNQASDVDVAVVTQVFEGIPWVTRMKHLCKLTGGPLRFVSPLGISPTELNEQVFPGVILTIRRHNKMIAWTSPEHDSGA